AQVAGPDPRRLPALACNRPTCAWGTAVRLVMALSMLPADRSSRLCLRKVLERVAPIRLRVRVPDVSANPTTFRPGSLHVTHPVLWCSRQCRPPPWRPGARYVRTVGRP